jgi:hypothetical protein
MCFSKKIDPFLAVGLICRGHQMEMYLRNAGSITLRIHHDRIMCFLH